MAVEWRVGGAAQVVGLAVFEPGQSGAGARRDGGTLPEPGRHP